MNFRLFQKRIREDIEKSANPSLYDEFWIWLFAVTGKKRAFFILNMDEPFSDQSMDQIYEIFKRRMAGEPFAYIVGTAPFYGRDFEVGRDVLVPRPDSEILIEVLLSFLCIDHKKFWNISQTDDLFQKNIREREFPPHIKNRLFFYDFCTGSGCLGITVFMELQKRKVCSEGVLTDLSSKAIAIAQENCRRLKVDRQLSCVVTNLAEGQTRKADFIISNPPYIPKKEINFLMKEVSCFEPKIALDGGEDGLLFYRRLAREAMPLLQENGFLLMEHGFDQANAVRSVFEQHGFNDIQSFKDYGGNDRVTLVQRSGNI